jgi:hypothetical protein
VELRLSFGTVFSLVRKAEVVEDGSVDGVGGFVKFEAVKNIGRLLCLF